MLGIAVPAAGAFAVALLATLVIAVAAGAAYRWPTRAFSMLMLLITFASVAAIGFSGRVMQISDDGLVSEPETEGGGTVGRLLLVAAIGAAVSLCVAWFFSLRKEWGGANRFQQRGLRAPTDIVIAFMCFYAAFSLLPIFLGQKSYFHVSLIYPFFVYLALFLWLNLSAVDPVVVMKRCLSILVFLSLGAAVVAPSFAMEPGYVGLIPGYSFRLWGVTASANTLGSIGAILLVLEAAQPSEKRWIRWSIFFGAAAVLGLTQSKTSIFAGLLGVTIIFTWRSLAKLKQFSVSQSSNHRSIALSMLALGMLAIVLAGALLLFGDASMLASLDGKLNSRAVGDLKTATGRTWIWKVAIEAGMENPLFGQGADFWNLDNRMRLGLSGAVHAHNLYLQVFSRSGFVGLGALLVFLYFLIRYCIRAAKITGGGSIALLVVFLIRSMTEVPIQPNAVLGGEFFAAMALFVYAMDRGARPFEVATRAVRRGVSLGKA